MKKDILICVCILLNSITALGNISAPPEPKVGNILGQNSLQSISVLSEELSINLIDVTKGENAKINAYYRIHTSKTIKNLQLVFVANNLTESKYLVKIDNQFVNGYLKEFDTIPQNWYPPDSIDFLNGKIPFKYTHKGLITFTIDSITAGEHTLDVTYEADVSEWYQKDDLSITRTFVYILRPYNGWKEFKNLNLNLFIPNGWPYTSNLKLDKIDSSALHGFWEELPGHHFSIAFRPNESKAKFLPLLLVILSSIISVLIFLKWIYVVIQYRIKKNKHRIIQILNGIVVSFVATIVFYVLFFYEPIVKDYLLEGHLNPFYTYGKAYFILAFPLIWFIILIPIFVIDFIMTKKIKNAKIINK